MGWRLGCAQRLKTSFASVPADVLHRTRTRRASHKPRRRLHTSSLADSDQRQCTRRLAAHQCRPRAALRDKTPASLRRFGAADEAHVCAMASHRCALGPTARTRLEPRALRHKAQPAAQPRARAKRWSSRPGSLPARTQASLH